MRVGVLALQGDWAAHGAALARIGAAWTPVRTAAELDAVEALVLPGGESTTMLHLLEREGWLGRLKERLLGGMPTLATCAGVILLAEEVEPAQEGLAVLRARVIRNAYGRQVASAVVPVRLANGLAGPSTLEGVFIRAPKITAVGKDVEVLGWRDEDPVLLRQGKILAATFHPEVTGDDRIQRFFLSIAEAGGAA